MGVAIHFALLRFSQPPPKRELLLTQRRDRGTTRSTTFRATRSKPFDSARQALREPGGIPLSRAGEELATPPGSSYGLAVIVPLEGTEDASDQAREHDLSYAPEKPCQVL